MFKQCTLMIWLAAVSCVLATAGGAHAEGFALYEYSARGVALGGAVMARVPDASAVAYNPALMTKLTGIHAMAGVSAIHPHGKMHITDEFGRQDRSILKQSLWFVPHLYYVQQLNEQFTLGVGEFSRFGLGLEYPHDWLGRFDLYMVTLQTASVNPSIAWAVTDKLSLAGGLEVIYATIDLKKRTQFPVPPQGQIWGLGEADVNMQDVDGFGLGFNVAGHYQFNEQWAVGLQYRSQAQIRAHGDVRYGFIGYQGAPAAAEVAPRVYDALFKEGGVHATVVLPDSVAGGLSWTPDPALSLEVGFVWTRWSTYRALNIHLPEPIGVSENPKHWKDVWRFNAGVEYKPLDWLALRASYVYDESPQTKRYADYMVPTSNRHMLSLGVGFNWDAWTLDLAYARIRPENRSYDASVETHVLKSTTYNSATDIVSLSLGYRF